MRDMPAYCVLLFVLGGPHATQAENLGRLFFTPAERNALDAGKFTATRESPALRGPRSVTLNGVVKRSDGATAVWVNGRSLDERSIPGVSATPSDKHRGAARVSVLSLKNPVELRVGQRLDQGGKVSEAYQSVPAQSSTAEDVASGRASKRATSRTPPDVSDRPTTQSGN